MSKLRDSAILSLLNIISAFQIAALTLEDIGYDDGQMFLRVLNRSNHEQDYKFIRLGSEVQQDIEVYLGEGRKGARTNALFLNRFGGALSLRSIWGLTPKKVVKRATYFILDEHNRIKVGVAKSPEYRLGTMQVDNADELTLVATVDIPERDIQKKFAHLHIRGEWYVGEDELWEYIEEIAKGQ